MNGNILVPIMTGFENDSEFVEKMKKSVKIILLYVVDKNLKDEQSFIVGEKIKKAEEVISLIKSQLPIDIKVIDCVEWGSWQDKIVNTVRIEQVGKVLLIQDKNTFVLKPFLISAGIDFEVFELKK